MPAPPPTASRPVTPDDLLKRASRRAITFTTSAGVPLVWVFNPAAGIRIVRVFRADGPIRELGQGDTLGGEDVLSGFVAVVRELLPEPAVP